MCRLPRLLFLSDFDGVFLYIATSIALTCPIQNNVFQIFKTVCQVEWKLLKGSLLKGGS